MKGNYKHKGGHNPLGSLSIFSFYFVLTVLAVSGLFSSDDILFEGPLVFILPDFTTVFTKVHNFFHYLIYALISLHILAIFYYQFFKKEKLIHQMLDGKSRNKKYGIEKMETKPQIIGFLILLFCLFMPSLLIFIFSN